MADCNPGAFVALQAGDGIEITGSGSFDDPYVVARYDTTPPDWQVSQIATTGAELLIASQVPITYRVTANNANADIVLPTWPTNRSGTVTLVITQDATGGRNIDFGAAGVLTSAPIVLSSAPGATDVVTLFWTGSAWIGALVAVDVA